MDIYDLLKKYNAAPVYSSNPDVNKYDHYAGKIISGGTESAQEKPFALERTKDLRKLGPDEEFDPVTGFVMPTTKAALREAKDIFAAPAPKPAKHKEGFLEDITRLPEGYTYDPVTGMVLKPKDEFLRSAGHDIASAYTNIAGQFASKEGETGKFNEEDLDILNLPDGYFLDPISGKIFGPEAADKNIINRLFGSKEKLYALSDEHARKSAELTEGRKSEMSKAGRFVYDVGKEAIHLGAQIVANKAVPGLGLTLMGTRAFGNASAEARREGANEDEAFLYGVGSALLEVGTEKLSNIAAPFKKAFGAGAADDAVRGAIRRLATSATGQRALTVLASGLGEGGEEMLQSALEPFLKRAIYDGNALEVYTDTKKRNEYLAQMLYEGAVGFALGAVGGGGQAIIEGGIENVNERGGSPSPGSPTPNKSKLEYVPEGWTDPAEVAHIKKQGWEENALMRQLFPEGFPKDGSMPDNALMRAIFPENNSKKTAESEISERSRAEYEKAPVNAGLARFIRKIRHLENPNTASKINYTISEVSSKAADAIKNITGIDVTGFFHRMQGNAVQHIDKRHGETGKHDHTLADINDLGKIPYILENFDDLSLLRNEEGEVQYDNEHKDKNGRPAPLVTIAKRINGTYYVIEAVPDSKSQTVFVKSAYIGNKQKQRGGDVLNVTNAPSLTSATSAAQIPLLSEPNLQQEISFVNGLSENPRTSPNQEHSLEPYITKEAEAAGATRGEHEVLPLAAVEAEAQARLGADYAGEVRRLESKYEWDAIDFEVSKSVLERLGKEASATGDYTKLIAWKRRNETQRTRWGQAGRVLSEHARKKKAHADIMSDIADKLARYGDIESSEKASSAFAALNGVAETAFKSASALYGGDNTEAKLIDAAISYSIEHDNGIDAVDLIRNTLVESGMNEAEAGELAAKSVNDFNRTVIDSVAGADTGIEGVGELGTKLSEMRKDGLITPADVESLICQTLDSSEPKLSGKYMNLATEADKLLTRLEGVSDTDYTGIKKFILEMDKRRGTDKGTTALERKIFSDAADYLQNQGEMQFLKNIARGQIMGLVEDARPRNVIKNIETFRFMAMLSKPSTITRNLAGNFAFLIQEWAATNVATVPDMIMEIRTGKRSTGPEQLFSKAGWHGMRDSVYKSFLEILFDVDSGGASKYGTGTQRQFKAAQGGLERILSLVQKYQSFALTTADEAFKGWSRAETERQLAELRKKGKLGERELADRANQVALERTFQDRNKVADAALKVRDFLNNKVGFDTGDGKRFGLGSLVAPFITVPVNLTLRAVNYTPVGLGVGLIQMANVMRKGTNADVKKQAKAALNVGRGMTGSAMVALAALLRAAGILRIPADDENGKKKGFLRAMGLSGAKFNASAFRRLLTGESPKWKHNDYLMSLEFLETSNTAMYMGALVYESAKERGFKLSDVGSANILSVLHSLNELPAISQIEAIENTWRYSKYGKDEWLKKSFEAGGAFLGSQALSFVPNVYKGILQAADPTIRNPYEADDQLGIFANQIYSILPGGRAAVPASLDNWGRERKTTVSPGLHALNRLVLPSEISRYQSDDVSEELLRLGKIPDIYAPKWIEQNGERRELSNAERRSYKRAYGQKAFGELDTLMQTNFYKSLDDDEKKNAIGKLLGLAENKGNEAVYNFKPREGFAGRVAAAENYGLDSTDILIADAKVAGIHGLPNGTGGVVKNSAALAKLKALYEMTWLTDEQRAYLAGVYGVPDGLTGLSLSQALEQLSQAEGKQGPAYGSEYIDFLKKYGIKPGG